MNRYNHLKHFSNTLILLLTLCFCLNANATLLNSDFSSGFDNWLADVEYFDGTDDIVVNGNIFASYTDNFSSSLGSATLTTAVDSNTGTDAWAIAMYQDFVLDTIMLGNSLWLDLDVLISLTHLDDFAFAQLHDYISGNTIDLTSGGPFDVTAWAGNNVALEFGVADADYNLGDTLTVSNISFTEVAAPNPVPAPPTLLLLGLGLILLKRTRA